MRRFKNQGTGIQAEPGSTVRDCAAYKNRGYAGIYAGGGSTITGCAAFRNEGTTPYSWGIQTAQILIVMQCTVYDNSHTNSPSAFNQGGGIAAGSESIVKDCTVYDNSVAMESGCILIPSRWGTIVPRTALE